ncbi:MAG: tetratricopeptide repeat protein [Candidatus Aureabacteria bacterium]|nr:tetratricopeptide repeat protein [Candidatus Auribacterota bacterium]
MKTRLGILVLIAAGVLAFYFLNRHLKFKKWNEINGLFKSTIELHNQGDYEQAMANLADIVDKSRRSFGEKYGGVSYYTRQLAEVYELHQKDDKAENLILELLDFYKKELDRYCTPAKEDGFSELDFIKFKLRHDKYNKKYRLRGETPGVLIAKYQILLSQIYVRKNRFDEAEKLMKSALEFRKKYPWEWEASGCNQLRLFHKKWDKRIAPPDEEKYYPHYQTSDILRMLGELYEKSHKIDLAEKTYQSALKEAENLNHDKIRLLENIGAFYLSQKKYEQAKKYYQDLLELLNNLREDAKIEEIQRILNEYGLNEI